MKEKEAPMKVKEMMSTDVKSCTEETDLATVVRIMWDGDCGIVPVVDGQLHVTGVITDRDICVAAGTRSLDPARIRVGEAMTRNAATCFEDADARTALRALKEHRVRRLPIVNRQNRLVGMLSVNDLAIRADLRQGAAVPAEEFLETLRVICAHHATV
jgi:CBS domain-containing protein